MFVLGNFIMALAKLLDIGLTLYMWIIVARALVSWVNPDPYNRIVVFLYRSTEPVLAPIRRRLSFFRGMGIDLSPVIAIAVIIFLQSFLLKSMMELTLYLR
jgi:YggT family protein